MWFSGEWETRLLPIRGSINQLYLVHFVIVSSPFFYRRPEIVQVEFDSWLAFDFECSLSLIQARMFNT